MSSHKIGVGVDRKLALNLLYWQIWSAWLPKNLDLTKRKPTFGFRGIWVGEIAMTGRRVDRTCSWTGAFLFWFVAVGCAVVFS